MGTAHPDTVEDVQEIVAGMGRNPSLVLVIDAGGVLFNNVTEDSPFLERIAARFGVAPDALRCGYDARSGAFETGKLSVPAALDACLADLGAAPLSGEDRRFVDQAYMSCVQINRPLAQELATLRAAGRTIVLANNEAIRWDILKDRKFRHLDLFSLVASSWRLGASKPHTTYFTRLHALLAPKRTDECWFVDDNADNVAAARDFGIPSSLFRSWSCRWPPDPV